MVRLNKDGSIEVNMMKLRQMIDHYKAEVIATEPDFMTVPAKDFCNLMLIAESICFGKKDERKA